MIRSYIRNIPSKPTISGDDIISSKKNISYIMSPEMNIKIVEDIKNIDVVNEEERKKIIENINNSFNQLVEKKLVSNKDNKLNMLLNSDFINNSVEKIKKINNERLELVGKFNKIIKLKHTLNKIEKDNAKILNNLSQINENKNNSDIKNMKNLFSDIDGKIASNLAEKKIELEKILENIKNNLDVYNSNIVFIQSLYSLLSLYPVCCICNTNSVNQVLIPCGHTLCLDCNNNIIGRNCPMCRKNIDERIGIKFY